MGSSLESSHNENYVADDQPTVSARVFKGAIWVAGGNIGIRLIGFANTLIVARLLAPDDFGVVAIGVTLTQLIQNFSDIGVSRAVIRFDQAGRREFDTLFTLSFLRGVLVSAVILILSVFASGMFGDPRVGPIFAAMALYAFIQCLYNPKFYEFEREISFRQETMVMAVEKVVMVVVSVAIAYFFRSFWAIVSSLIVGAVIRLGMTYAMRPYLPRFGLAAVGTLISFTGWLTALGAVVALNNKLSPLIVGKLLGPTLTGLFTVGSTVAYLPGSDIADPAARALFPGLASLKNDSGKMRDALLFGVAALSTVAIPLSIAFALMADDLVLLLLGPQWGDAALVVQVYAPTVGITCVFAVVTDYAVAQGKAKQAFVRELAYLILQLPVFIWATAFYGYIGAVWASAFCGLLHAGSNAWLYTSLTKKGVLDLFKAVSRPLAAAFMMVVGVTVFQRSGLTNSCAVLIRLAAEGAVAAAVLCSSIYGLWAIAGKPYGPETKIAQLLHRGRLNGN